MTIRESACGGRGVAGADARRPEVGAAQDCRMARLFVCAECAFAQLFAVQPRAVCMQALSVFHGRVLFAGQPACAIFVRRDGADTSLAWYKRHEER